MARLISTLRLKIISDKKYVQDMISDISHQLKTPISVIRLNNDLLDERPLPFKKQHELFAKIETQLTRMEWLIFEQLKLARLEAGSISYKYEEINVRSLFARLFANLSLAAEKNNNIFENNCDKDSCLVFDRGWLLEAFGNIINNSLSNTSNGEITVTATETPLSVQLNISDTGNGIPSEKLSKIFRRFNVQRSSPDEKNTGIGMSIAKKIIEDGGGRISVQSVVGKGTRFTVVFMKKLAAATAEPTSTTP